MQRIDRFQAVPVKVESSDRRERGINEGAESTGQKRCHKDAYTTVRLYRTAPASETQDCPYHTTPPPERLKKNQPPNQKKKQQKTTKKLKKKKLTYNPTRSPHPYTQSADSSAQSSHSSTRPPPTLSRLGRARSRIYASNCRCRCGFVSRFCRASSRGSWLWARAVRRGLSPR